MSQETFKIVTQAYGTQYIIQSIDEKDKNHGVNDTDPANQGQIFADPGKN